MRRRHPKIGVIGANPSQSKHLETATMKIHGMDVDFVNLRANEVYGADSRIPTFGTPSSGGDPPGPPAFSAPLQDALRRKVSRERVGKELEGMLSGKHAPPGRALDAIARLHLAGSVFAFPGTLGWEESRLLLSALPILIKGQVDEREKLATTARPAGWHGEHADVLASPLTSVDHRLLDHSSKKFRVEN